MNRRLRTVAACDKAAAALICAQYRAECERETSAARDHLASMDPAKRAALLRSCA